MNVIETNQEKMSVKAETTNFSVGENVEENQTAVKDVLSQ